VILTQTAPDPVGPYNQAIKANGFLFASGQIALIPGTTTMQTETFEAEVRQVMTNVGEVLKAAGSSFSDLVKVTVFLTDMGTFPEFNAIYSEYIPAPYPARSTIEVSQLPKGGRIEVEVIALAI
jgi:2-iminobutanoate/2-iminopropanoate deaminase